MYDKIYGYDWIIGNIGDYIQSLALQYLPKNSKPLLIDRDRVKFYNGTKVKLIMNGWMASLSKEMKKYQVK